MKNTSMTYTEAVAA